MHKTVFVFRQRDKRAKRLDACDFALYNIPYL